LISFSSSEVLVMN